MMKTESKTAQKPRQSNKKKNIEAIYPLSPLQQGLLFHNSLDPDSGAYIEQLECIFTGKLDITNFQEAWQQTVNRHPILRTGFFAKSLDKPVQIVNRQVNLPIETQDWCHLSNEEQNERWEDFLTEDRCRGFKLSKPPLMRLTLVQTAEDTYHFLWTHHHILLDGWSLPLVLKEVLAFYDALHTGQELQIQSPRPYRDYITWLQHQDLKAAEKFWREQLAGFSAPTPLTVDRDLKTQPTGYAEGIQHLSTETTAALQTFAQQHQLTLNTLIQGAWALLLSKYSREQDIVFGVTTSGRPTELNGVESMVGLFINTLPIRVKASPDVHLIDWLKTLQSQNVSLRQYDYTPLVEVQRWSDVPGGKPLFESIFAFENYPLDKALQEQNPESFQIQNIKMHEQTNYPLGLVVMPDTALTLRIIYDQQHFDSETINRMLGHLGTLMESMLANPRASLSELTLLTLAERRQLLVDWNATEADFPHDQCIHQLFEAQVEKTPDATAVIYQDQSLTYSELNAKANQLAHYLRDQGVKPDVLVGLCLERSLEMVVGLLGILKAGGAYVPLDPSYPQERIKFMIEDANLSVLVTQSSIEEMIAGEVMEMVYLDTALDKIGMYSEANPSCVTLPDHSAYVIYTSGSTGRPKGVQLHHRGLLNLTTAQRNIFNLQDVDRVLQFASFGFDASVWECFMALTSGAALYLGTSEQLLPGSRLLDFINDQKISVATFPPSALNALPDTPLTSLKTIIVAGEQCFSALATRWSSKCRFFNAYGPTESTVCATISQCSISDAEPTIGAPIANTQIYILDSSLSPVPIGVTGEIHIGGIGLARGYLNRPELTAETFLPNPFSSTPGERLYKTGDLARYLPDGNIEFLGRIDHQVKIRGFRIELGEIEATLGSHPSVKETVVIAREDSPDDKRLVAYVVASSDSELDVSALREFLKGKLPDYMIPSVFVFLEQLPLTSSGKVDRKVLPAPEGRAGLEQEYVTPRTSTEELLAEIWAEVLGVERVGIHDNYFELGGHSLLATQVISRIRDACQVELPLSTLFVSPTVAELAHAVEDTRLVNEALCLSPIEPVSRQTDLPLSFAQQRLWFLDQMEPNSPFYNISVVVQLQGALKRQVLQSSLNEIVKRHEVLRTTFPTERGKAKQVILSSLTLDISIINLLDVPESRKHEKAKELATKTARQPFNLAKGPLIRAQLIQLAEDDHILQVTVHHIVADGWSFGVIIEELVTLYQAYSENQESALSELSIQYADFAHWQRRWLETEILSDQLNYWKEQLKNLPPLLKLPVDHARPVTQTFEGKRFPITVSSGQTQALRLLSKEAGVTLFMTLLAIFEVLLYRHTGQKDFAVGTAIAGRNRAETENLIGFFVNTLVLRANLANNPGFNDVLAKVKETTLGAYAHQDLPFERLIDELLPERDISHTPLFQVMFVLQNAPLRPLELPDLRLTPWHLDPGIAKFDLTLDLTEEGNRLIGAFEYNTNLFNESTIARLSEHFFILIDGVTKAPGTTISELSILSAAERKQLLVERNPATITQPGERLIHRQFELQAEKTPDATAVIYDGQSLTYSQLNHRANQLAHYLRSLGIKQDVLVAICINRCLDMIVGLLGILKAGGAYLPLDPALPKERLRFILQDSEARVILTQAELSFEMPVGSAEVICLDQDSQKFEKYRTQNLCNINQPENLAYVIYTSGSTGNPKGTLINHSNVTRLFSSTQSWFQFDERDIWTLFHSYAFDFSVWEIWGALLYGGKLVIVPYLTSRSPEDFYQLLCEYNVTVLNQTPMAFYQLSNVDGEQRNESLSLRLIIFGGESLDIQRLKPWFLRHGDKQPQLINMYGITETTVHVTFRPISMKDIDCNKGSVIGHAIPDLQLYILDEYLNPVPIGVPGELCVGGPGLARGYLNRPDLTQEKFISSPFREGERLYRSGDLARFLSDGDIEYLGRIDQQVKIRGFRIELGEIQAQLENHPAVLQCLVLVISLNADQKHLAAYLVVQNDHKPSVDELRSYLMLYLPDYMIPTFFEYLERFPLTVNGKIDRAALPSPGFPDEPGRMAVAPRNSVEETIACIWKNILSVDNVSVKDNFFSLGGDSIRAIEVISLAKEAGLSLSVQDIFRFQTLEDLALAVHPLEKEEISLKKTSPFDLIKPEDRALLPDDVEDAYPLAALQAGMLFHSALSPDTTVYHDVFSYHLKAPFDVQALRRAIERITKLHPVLRTSFELTKFSEPLQLVHRDSITPFAIQDLRHVSIDEQEAVIDSWIQQEKSNHFHWECHPLLRYQVHRRTNKTFQLTLSFHHAILDGWSVATMLSGLFATYLNFLRKESWPDKTSKEFSYRDFVVLEKKTVQAIEVKNFWKQALRDISVHNLPEWKGTNTKGANTLESKEQPDSYDVAISTEISKTLQKVAKELGVPSRTLLLAAHLKVLSTLTGTHDVLTGLVVNGRIEEQGSKDILGLFLNTVPLRLDLQVKTWVDLIKETYKKELELLPYRRYPLAEIQKVTGGAPLFDVVFNFTHFHVYDELNGFSDIEFLGGTFFEHTNFPLLVNFSQSIFSGDIELQLRFNANKICKEQIKQIGGYYLQALKLIGQSLYSRHDVVTLMSKYELDKVLDKWNSSKQQYTTDTCFYQLFESQVEKRPQSISVVFENQSMTYAELNARANQLAHYLRSLGVKPDVLVGICVERSLEMIVGLLGILKAGGAYVPLDPTYPAERLAFMIEDAKVSVLVTQNPFVEKLPAGEADIVCLDTDEDKIRAQSSTNPASLTLPEHCAYVIYTSGSTGRPKGIQISHRSLVNFLMTMLSNPGISKDDVVVAITTICFDISILEMFLPLIAGARTIIVGAESAQDGNQLLGILSDSCATVMQATPATWKLLLESGWQHSSLIKVLCGGEALSSQLAIQLRQRTATLWNMYGPTETTVWSTIYRIENNQSSMLIGSPIANTQIYILDAALNPVPIGVAGELHIGGIGLARGYLNRPDLTAEKFIPNPFSDTPGERLYKTGDLARYLPDGNIEFLGRIDHQVKIRGFRIELGEIEATLEQHKGIQEVVVVAREDSPGDRRLVAYLVTTVDAGIAVNVLRKFLKDKLPDYMIPAAFVFLDALPLTPNGKLDRKALPAPEGRMDIGQEYVAPRTSIEQLLADVWAEVLVVDRVGVHDNFFDMGGHSLLVLRLISLIEHRLGKANLPVAILFQNPTISQLARVLDKPAQPQAGSSLVPINPQGSLPPLFCVPGSEGLVLSLQRLANHLGREQPFYGLQALGLDGKSNPVPTVEEIAINYIEAIKTVQPKGPYFLAGYSFGGWVAFEMACCLQQQGEQVSQLCLIDTLAPSESKIPEDDKDNADLMASIFRLLERLWGVTLSITYNDLVIMSPEQQVEYLLNKLDNTRILSGVFSEDQLRGLLEVIKTNSRMRYFPRSKYPKGLALFRAIESQSGDVVDVEGSEHSSGQDIGWETFCEGSVNVQFIPGDHNTLMVEPNVQVLAEKVSNLLKLASKHKAA